MIRKSLLDWESLVVENFGESAVGKKNFGKKTLANGHNSLLANKTLANQMNVLITSCTAEDK